MLVAGALRFWLCNAECPGKLTQPLFARSTQLCCSTVDRRIRSRCAAPPALSSFSSPFVFLHETASSAQGRKTAAEREGGDVRCHDDCTASSCSFRDSIKDRPRLSLIRLYSRISLSNAKSYLSTSCHSTAFPRDTDGAQLYRQRKPFLSPSSRPSVRPSVTANLYFVRLTLRCTITGRPFPGAFEMVEEAVVVIAKRDSSAHPATVG